MKKEIFIGIDPGVHTGMAVYSPSDKKFIECKTYVIHMAFQRVMALGEEYAVYMVIEDARKRKWFGPDRNNAQGAGAIKIQCTQWNMFAEDMKKKGVIVDYKMIHPIRGGTKLDSKEFRKITGYTGVTSNHARDAGMMVFQINKVKFNLL